MIFHPSAAKEFEVIDTNHGSYFCLASSVSESSNYLIHFFVTQVLQHSRHSRIYQKVSFMKFTKRMFVRVEAEAEVHCHTITSGAVSDFGSKANKITTEGCVLHS